VKQKTFKKLTLQKQTVTNLQQREQAMVRGGLALANPTSGCFTTTAGGTVGQSCLDSCYFQTCGCNAQDFKPE
jgi:hypothetical protein